MEIDPRTPVIIGKSIVRSETLSGPEPLDQWEKVSRQAIEDAALPASAAEMVDGLFITDCMSWRYDDPAGRLAQRLGTDARIRTISAPSGTAPQTLIHEAAEHIRNGDAQVTLICGGEALASVKAYRKAGDMPPWSYTHPEGSDYHFDLDARQHPGESAIGLTEGIGAVYGFAMRDIARRAHLGIAPADYRNELGQTLAEMTKVAAANPHAWFRHEREPEFLITPRADNRMISYPYTKHMVAIIDVDISAGLLMVSEAWADAHAVPRELRVYPWTYCYAEDPVFIAPRDKLWKSEAMAAASQAALDAAGLSIEDISYVDLYSCFASAVNFGRDALGIAARSGDQITSTGGLPYAGGPGSSYGLTSMARMVDQLRASPGTKGVVSGLGMMMSNHNYAIYSAQPPGPDVRQPDMAAVQAGLDAIPQRVIDDSYVGEATVATYTIMYAPDGEPSTGAFICDLPSGARCYATMDKVDLLRQAEQTELVGRKVWIERGTKVGKVVRLVQ